MVNCSCLWFLFGLVQTLISSVCSLTASSPLSLTITQLYNVFPRELLSKVGEKRFCCDTSVLLRCYYAFVLKILEYSFPAGAGYSELFEVYLAKGNIIHHDRCAKIRYTYLNR